MYVYNPANFNVTRAVYASKIEQVSNFPTANSQNFNSVIEGGVYNILTGNYIGTLNSPPGLYGTMMVETGGNFITQTVTSHEAAVYTRSYYNGVWTAWNRVDGAGTSIGVNQTWVYVTA